jgi:hypothetical protein
MSTTTRTYATSWSEANVRYVMDKVYEDIRQHVSAGLLSDKRAKKWCEDLTYLLDMQAISEFQIQYHHSDGRKGGLGYRVNDAGQLFTDDSSGGLDLYGIGRPNVSIVITYSTGCLRLLEVEAELCKRGWTNNGRLLTGGTHDHTYSRNGYGLQRLRFGDWE